MKDAKMKFLRELVIDHAGKKYNIKSAYDEKSAAGIDEQTLYYSSGRTRPFEGSEFATGLELLAVFKSAVEAFVPARFRLAQFEALGSYEEITAAVQESKKRKTTEPAAAAPVCYPGGSCSLAWGNCCRCTERVCSAHNQIPLGAARHQLCRKCVAQK